MAKGINQEQVDAAADAIMSRGENPTVEKIRSELGTGSPNTVTRMLDIWRIQLGERLHRVSTLPELPLPVGQAMIELWRLTGRFWKRLSTNWSKNGKVGRHAYKQQRPR